MKVALPFQSAVMDR